VERVWAESGAGKRQQKPKKRTRASNRRTTDNTELKLLCVLATKKTKHKGKKEGRKKGSAREWTSEQASEVTNYVYTQQQQQQLPHEKERKKERKKFIPTEKHGRNKD
jgi:hypothetical protein